MNKPISEQIHEEHQDILFLCDQVGRSLDNMDNENGYNKLLESVKELHHLMINVHQPKDRKLARYLNIPDGSISGYPAILDCGHEKSVKSLNRLDELIDAAGCGLILPKVLIANEAVKLICQLHSVIGLEECIYFPRPKKTQVATRPDRADN